MTLSKIEVIICANCRHEPDTHEDCHRCDDDREMHRRQVEAKELNVWYREVNVGNIYSQTRRSAE